MEADHSRIPRGVDTEAVHGPHLEHTGAVSTPIVHSATFSFPSLEALVEEQDRGAASSYYQRTGHPTTFACEERLAHLEGSESALLFPSGMAAISSAFLALLKAGDHIVTIHQCYGGTLALLEWGAQRLGWSYDLVDARDPASFERAFKPNTRVFHIESPTNPLLTVVDIAAAAKLAHAHGAKLTLDNTIASPIGQHGLPLGADLVMYSATKSLGGHSDLLAGVLTGSAAGLEPVQVVRSKFGPIAEPSMAWQLERSLKTLPLRVRAGNANALELSQRLAKHSSVAQVFYAGLPSHAGHAIAARQMPLGFGPLLSFEVKGGAEAARVFVGTLRLVKFGPSLGGVESRCTLPAFTSHVMIGAEGRRKAGIPEGLVRLSAGVEAVDDLWADIEQALAKVATVGV